MKNKWAMIATFNILLLLAFQFQYELKLDMILNPKGSSSVAKILFIYLFQSVPVVTLLIWILFIYKGFSNQLEKDHVISTLLSFVLVLVFFSNFF